ncbi:MAG: hypothetical protein ACJA07_003978 [Rhodococcus sp. (in: high G+C Gram-positive bacteria)]|jgi:hypothetical protein
MMLNALLHAQDWDSARRKRWERVFINRQFLRIQLSSRLLCSEQNRSLPRRAAG